MARKIRTIDPVEERRRAGERLEILDAIAWSLDHGPELLMRVVEAETPEEVVEELMRTVPTTRQGATAILDNQIRRWSRESRERILHERAELRRRIGYLDGI